ncbi:MAG: 23S rRNA (guanosine(2251)-2'-O)-methyltransferase RlmB [Acidimicrobiia bacterium]
MSPPGRGRPAGGRGRGGGRPAPTRRTPTPPRGPERLGGGAVRGKVGASARRNGVGGEQVEGRQAVRELLLAGRRRVREVWVLADAEPSPVLDDILELAGAERVTVREVGRGRFFAEARCEAPQGVLARAEALPETELEDLARPWEGQPPFLVAVDGVTDPGNLGALLRSAECAGATGVVLPRHRAVHVTPTVTKAAVGAVEHLRFALVGGLPNALARLRELGCWIVGLDAAGEVPLWDLPAADGPLVVVLGAEGAGLSRLVRQRCDALVSIPMRGHLDSLNVATAGALACFEVARRRTAPGS